MISIFIIICDVGFIINTFLLLTINRYERCTKKLININITPN
ncbi:hypothetical protein Q7O_003878 [Pectobacterium carotovorum subsp. carotovorum PCCS1]|nr:hypothetical protein [Pectobacterium carotovorum subsp. carotovorum PCCS1]